MTEKPDFDSIKHTNIYGEEYWSACDLMPLLGYGNKWQNFEAAIKRAMIACEQVGQIVQDQFTDASKLIEAGKGAKRPVQDYLLSRALAAHSVCIVRPGHAAPYPLLLCLLRSAPVHGSL
jgi:DNA-damage-inducible protein D